MEEPQEVEFISESEEDLAPQKGVAKAKGEIVAWLIKTGVVKSEKGANRIMLFVALLGFIVTFYILFRFVL